MPTPRQVNAIRAVAPSFSRRTDNTNDPITSEIIEGPASVGKYFILGTATPARSGLVNLAEGDQVSVQWKNGSPFMILNINNRRGSGADDPSSRGGIVETLFISGVEGAREIYYRNDKQVTNLKIRKLLVEDPTRLRWGFVDNAFIVLCEPSYTFYVFRLRRAPRQAAGTNKQAAKLVQIVALGTKNITLLDFHMINHNHSALHTQEINAQAGSGYALGDDHVFDVGNDFDDHLIQKVNIAQLVAGQANVLDGSVDTFFPNNRVIGPEFETILFQFISDFWLDGNGSKKKPYKVMISLLADYRVTGNDQTSGTDRSVATTCTLTPLPGHEGFEQTYNVGSGGWGGDLHTRSGYIINITDSVVVQSGTGDLARTFNNSESGGATTAVALVDRVDPPPNFGLCNNLSPTIFIPGVDFPPEGATGFTFSGTWSESIQGAFAPNLLDPVGSPFMLEDPLTEIVTAGTSPGVYYCLSGQAKPNVPVFFDEATRPGSTIELAISTFRMVNMTLLFFDAKDPLKTRVFAVLRHNSGVSPLRPEEFAWAVKAVILDGKFNVKHILTDWTRQVFKNAPHPNGWEVGAVTVLGSNGKHVMWREHIGSTPTGNPGPITGGEFVPTNRVKLADYTAETPTVQIVEADNPNETTQADEFMAHHFKVLGEEVDLFYEGREGDKDHPGRRFIKAWDPKTKIPTLDQTSGVYPEPDKRFKSLQKLKDLPKGVTVDVGDGTYHGVLDLRVVGGGAK
jgi:hypothetical protein